MSKRATKTQTTNVADEFRELIELIAVCRDNPVAFVIAVLGVYPSPWQRKFLMSLVTSEKKRFAVRAGHGVGKTTTEAWVILWFLFTRLYPKVIATAPSRQQLLDILWPEISKWLSGSDILKRLFEWQKTRIISMQDPERWWASARTANKPENFAGIHEDDVLMLFDEASGVDDKIFEVAEGALTTPGAYLLIFGNPTRNSGEFYDAFNSRRHLYNVTKVSCLDMVGQVINGKVLVTTEYVENLKAKYGETSDVFRVRVKGEFPRVEPDVFIPLEYAEAATMRDVLEYRDKLDAAGNIIEQGDPIYAGPIHIGVDPARYGGDEIVYYWRIGPHFFPPEVHKDQETTVTAGQVIRLGRELLQTYHRPQIIIKIDVGGLGAGVYDMVVEQAEKEFGEWVVVPVNFGGAPTIDKKDEYADFASQMWGELRDMLRGEEIHLPSDQLTTAQISSRKYKVDSKGRIRIESKDDYKKRHHESPDRADGVVMCAWDPGRGVSMNDAVQTTERKPETRGMRKKVF